MEIQQAEKVQPTAPFAIDGHWVTLGGRQYLAPPLNLKAVRKYGPQLSAMGSIEGLPTAEQLDLFVGVTHAALVRNYPAMTVDEVEEVVDLGNFGATFLAVVRAAGFKEQRAGEPPASP